MNRTECKTAVRAALVACGWQAHDGTAIAQKTFATATAPKVAHVYLSACPSGAFTIQGDYQSEGRNVLESALVLLPAGASIETATAAAQKFAADCDARVSKTYAVRLLAHVKATA